MMKAQEQARKSLEKESLYRDALYYSLIHKGVREDRARLEVKRIVKRRRAGHLNN